MSKWYTIALAELGQAEVAGTADNPRILDYYAAAGFANTAHDETAWCAAFANWCLARAGLPITHSLMARSFLGYGKKVSKPIEGDITVLRRGADPASGHVGFYSHSKGGRVFLLAGNQGDKVSVASFPESDVLAYRRPSETVKVDRKWLTTTAASAGAGAATALPSIPAPPDLSPLTAWQSAAETVSGLGSWALQRPLLTAGLVLWLGVVTFLPSLVARLPSFARA